MQWSFSSGKSAIEIDSFGQKEMLLVEKPLFLQNRNRICRRKKVGVVKRKLAEQRRLSRRKRGEERGES